MRRLVPFIVIVAFSLLSIYFDGISAYDIPLPFGWLSDPNAVTLNAGCSMFQHHEGM